MDGNTSMKGFRMTKIILEKEVEAYLKKKVEGLGGICLKFPATFAEGIPDRLIILPGGHYAWVELKRPKGGRLSEIQKYQHKKLRTIGCKVYVLKNYQEVDDFIKENENDK